MNSLSGLSGGLHGGPRRTTRFGSGRLAASPGHRSPDQGGSGPRGLIGRFLARTLRLLRPKSQGSSPRSRAWAGNRSRLRARNRPRNRLRNQPKDPALLSGEYPLPARGGRFASLRTARVGGVVIALCLAVAGAFFAYRAVTRSSYFSVDRYTFENLTHVTPKELVAFAKLETGGNIFSVDLADVARRVAAHPWVESAQAIRRLPHTILIRVTERKVGAAVLMDRFYLADVRGVLFKRATYDELDGLAVVTGLSRSDYETHRTETEARIRKAIQVAEMYQKVVSGPPLGEVHLGPAGEVTLFARNRTLEIRLGRSGYLARLKRLDLLLTALGKKARRLRLVRVDNRARPNRITVRFGPPEAGDEALEPLGGKSSSKHAARKSGNAISSGPKKATGRSSESKKAVGRPTKAAPAGRAHAQSPSRGRTRPATPKSTEDSGKESPSPNRSASASQPHEQADRTAPWGPRGPNSSGPSPRAAQSALSV